MPVCRELLNILSNVGHSELKLAQRNIVKASSIRMSMLESSMHLFRRNMLDVELTVLRYTKSGSHAMQFTGLKIARKVPVQIIDFIGQQKVTATH